MEGALYCCSVAADVLLQYDFQIVGFYKDTIINKLVELDCKWVRGNKPPFLSFFFFFLTDHTA